MQCHVKGKQTPAIQELKWLSWAVVSVKMEPTKQIILEITEADFALPGEVMGFPLCVVLALMASLIEMLYFKFHLQCFCSAGAGVGTSSGILWKRKGKARPQGLL